MKYILLLLISHFHINYGHAKNIDYNSGGKKYQGYMLSTDKNAPLVIIVHDWDGLTDYEIKRAEMLNKLGYSVFAVDLFGKGIRPKETKEKKTNW